MIRASDWRAFERATLRGFCTLTLEPSGIVLHGCTLHEEADRRWIGLPGKPQIDAEGRVVKVPGSGRPRYLPIVEIIGKESREQFQKAALAAGDELLAKERAR